MSLNPPTQYADEANLRARQRRWELQRPPFDLVGWTIGLALDERPDPAHVLDVGCGNGAYLRRLDASGITATGCDLSVGMLHAAHPYGRLVNADATALPFADDAFDIGLAPHMLYHVEDRASAAIELRRVLRPDGVLVAVTNGGGHMEALRTLVEQAAQQATPGWIMRNPSTHVFSLDNGAAQLRVAFDRVELVRPEGVAPVRVSDADVAARYVASTADHYQPQVDRPWAEVVEHVRGAVQEQIDTVGEFVVAGESGAFVGTRPK